MDITTDIIIADIILQTVAVGNTYIYTSESKSLSICFCCFCFSCCCHKTYIKHGNTIAIVNVNMLPKILQTNENDDKANEIINATNTNPVRITYVCNL